MDVVKKMEALGREVTRKTWSRGVCTGPSDRDGDLLLVQVTSSREAPHISWAQELNMHAIPLESGPEQPPVGVHGI